MLEARAWLARHRTALSLVMVLVLIALGFAAMQQLTRELHFSHIRTALHALTPWQILASVLFTALSYLTLTGYDVLALRTIGRPLPWRVAALASFTSYTLSHNLGLSLLTGGSARYRIYTAAGLDGPDVARVIGIASATFWSGVVTVAAVALLARSGPIALAGVTIPAAVSHAIAAVARIAKDMPRDAIILANLCGRGDKDIFTVADALGVQI